MQTHIDTLDAPDAFHGRCYFQSKLNYVKTPLSNYDNRKYIPSTVAYQD